MGDSYKEKYLQVSVKGQTSMTKDSLETRSSVRREATAQDTNRTEAIKKELGIRGNLKVRRRRKEKRHIIEDNEL